MKAQRRRTFPGLPTVYAGGICIVSYVPISRWGSAAAGGLPVETGSKDWIKFVGRHKSFVAHACCLCAVSAQLSIPLDTTR